MNGTLDPRWTYMPSSDRPRGNPPRLPALGEPIAVRHSSGFWIRNYFAGWAPGGNPYSVPRLPMGAGRFDLRCGYGRDGWQFPDDVRMNVGHFRARARLPILCEEHGLTPGEQLAPALPSDRPQPEHGDSDHGRE